MADERNSAVAARMAAQLGLISARDLVELGVTRKMVGRRVASGEWERIAPGVWRLAAMPRSWRQELHAGSMWLGEDGAISHRAAAAVHRFDDFEPSTVEFLAPLDRRRRGGPWTVHTTCDLPRIDVVRWNGLRVTSPSRTIIDLAGLGLPADLIGKAIDSAVRDGGTAPAYLAKRLDHLRQRGRAGVRLLDRLMLDSGGHSYLERQMLRLLREAGLPRPRTQVIHRRDGVTIARVDFQYDDVPVILEVSGRRGHVTEADRLRDAQRRNELQLEGFVVVEFVTSQVLDDPVGTVAVVAEARRLAARMR